MEDIIKQTLTAIPQYLLHFFQLLFAPRQFPLERLPKDASEIKESLTEALKFLLISYALTVILMSFKSESANAMKTVGFVAVTTLIYMSLLALPIFLAWKIFGSKKPFLNYFIILSYHLGVGFIIISVFIFLSESYLRTFDKEIWDNIQKFEAGTIKLDSNWGSKPNVQISTGITAFGFVLFGIYYYIGWGAYRLMNETKRWRSLVVLHVAGVFTMVLFPIMFLIIKALQK